MIILLIKKEWLNMKKMWLKVSSNFWKYYVVQISNFSLTFFLTIYITTIPIPNTKENLGFWVRVNQPYLYYIMECRRIEKSEKEQYLNF